MAPRLTHLAVVGVVAAAVLIPAAATSAHREAHSVPLPTASDNLRDLAKRTGLRIGTAVDMDAFNADTRYRETLNAEFNVVTAENVMKWQLIEPVRGQLDFAKADQLVESARMHGQKVRGHTLIWHNQLPTWLTTGVADGSITPTELRQILRQHIFDEVGHFRGKIWAWDVVNEVIDDSANLRNNIFLANLGSGYIADAFRWAHQADPRAKLYVNDYNVDGKNAKSDAYFALVQDLLRQGVPVHGFGSQGHLGVQFGFFGALQVAENLRRFEALGLETSITEADVRMVLPVDNPKRQGQAQGYSTMLQGCLLATRCVAFVIWGYTDKYQWVPGVFPGQGSAAPFDENFQPKPAYDEMRAILLSQR